MSSHVAYKNIYHGRVQGVGFRFTVLRHAAGYDSLTGYVRNCANGTVEVYVEGERAEVTAFLDDIARDTPGHITKTDSVAQTPAGAYTRFDIERGYV